MTEPQQPQRDPRLWQDPDFILVKRFGYSLKADDPHRRLGDLCSPALVVHDRQDPVIAHAESEVLDG